MAEPSTSARNRLVTAVALSAALAPLNSTMIAVALPDMQRAFSVNSGALREALVTSYLLTSIVLQTMGGKASDRIGHHRSLAIGQFAFGAAATCAYLLPYLPVVTAARIAMAAAGAVIVPSALALLRSELPVEVRGRAFGAFGAAMSLAAALGPKLGAALVTHFGWRAIFVANVPVLVLAAFLAHVRAAPRVPRAERAPRFDLLGSLLLGLSLALCVVGSERAPLRFLLLVGALGLVPFAWWERRAADPLVDFSLFRRPAFVGGGLIIAFQNLAMYSLLFELPQMASRLFSARPRDVGSALFAMMAAMVIAAPLAGRASERFGARALAVSGSLCALAAMLWLRFSAFESLSDAILPLALLGAGLGLTTAPSQTAALSSVPKEKGGMAAGLTSTLRYIGGMAGLSTLGLVLTDSADRTLARQEHTHALSIFCIALSLALLCAFALPGKPTGSRSAGATSKRQSEAFFNFFGCFAPALLGFVVVRAKTGVVR
ncbi:MAG: MFS transporter [Polyangiaceae bacterium]